MDRERSIATRWLYRAVRNGECLEHSQKGGKRQAYGKTMIGKTKWRLHRLVFHALIRPLRNGELVLHKCDNERCINPKHLFAGNAFDNMRDCAAKGRNNLQRHAGLAKKIRQKQGPSSPVALFEEANVREIKNMLAEGIKGRDIAARFKCSEQVISKIKRGKYYQWVGPTARETLEKIKS